MAGMCASSAWGNGTAGSFRMRSMVANAPLAAVKAYRDAILV